MSQDSRHHSGYSGDRFQKETSTQPLVGRHDVMTIPQLLQGSLLAVIGNGLVSERVSSKQVVAFSEMMSSQWVLVTQVQGLAGEGLTLKSERVPLQVGPMSFLSPCAQS